MPILNSVIVGDTYQNSQASLTNQIPSRGGYYSVAAASVFMQIQYGRLGTFFFEDEQLVQAGGYGTLPANCTGIQFRNAVAGVPATATLAIFIGDEPVVDIGGLGGGGITEVSSGQKTGVHGTATPLVLTNTPCQGVSVKADATNSGLVFLGGSNVTTSNGYMLSPGDAVGFDIDNLNAVFFDVTNTGAGVSWLAVG